MSSLSGSVTAEEAPSEAPAPPRARAALRLLLLGTLVLFVVGVASRFIQWSLLTAALGPTLYVFLAHPDSETARLRAAVIGHAVALATALGALALFGLWGHPSVDAVGFSTLRQAAAAGLAVGATLGILELTNTHHAPAASTALLVATGLARPGAPLYGLLIGLAGVIALGPLLGRVPLGRAAMIRTGRD